MSFRNFRGLRFEELVAELLRALGCAGVRSNIRVPMSSGEIEDIDVVYQGLAGPIGVEVKFYRYSSPPRVDLFISALEQTVRKKRVLGAHSGLLVMSCPKNSALGRAAHDFPDIEVWDANDLFERASDFPELSREFEKLFEVSAPPRMQPLIKNAHGHDDFFRETPEVGRLLADALLAVPPGRAGASDFETACINALKYLFELDLHGWHEQSNTDDDLHRRDLICRILPKADVWNLMLTDLGSRYVIFEFKNYTQEITQKEVVTTERYLYPSALRNVAILISPKGCAVSATKVIQGAMREHGKLILSLSVPEVEFLLIAKDAGTDPNTYLFEKVDQFLMRLGR